MSKTTQKGFSTDGEFASNLTKLNASAPESEAKLRARQKARAVEPAEETF